MLEENNNEQLGMKSIMSSTSSISSVNGGLLCVSVFKIVLCDPGRTARTWQIVKDNPLRPTRQGSQN
jgi:hypothetical protein